MKGIILAGGSGTRLISINKGNFQTDHAGIRQTDDLLSIVYTDACRNP